MLIDFPPPLRLLIQQSWNAPSCLPWDCFASWGAGCCLESFSLVPDACSGPSGCGSASLRGYAVARCSPAEIRARSMRSWNKRKGPARGAQAVYAAKAAWPGTRPDQPRAGRPQRDPHAHVEAADIPPTQRVCAPDQRQRLSQGNQTAADEVSALWNATANRQPARSRSNSAPAVTYGLHMCNPVPTNRNQFAGNCSFNAPTSQSATAFSKSVTLPML